MFAHIFFLYHPEINKGGIFGYEYWSVFFASLMYPVLFFDFAYLWQRVSKNYITDKKGIRYSNMLIYTFYFFSLFYLAITAFPYNNTYYRIGLSPAWYYIVAGVGSVLMIMLFIYFPERVKERTIKYLKQELNDLNIKLGKYLKAIQIYTRFATQQRFKAKDLREYEVDYRNVLTKVDQATD